MAFTLSELSEISPVNSNFPSTIHYLQAKVFHPHNIIVGSDPVQLRFAEQQFGLKYKRVERVSDDMLLGSAPALYNVIMAHQIDLSPEVRKRTGIWSAMEIKKGSAAIGVLVEVANSLAPSATKGAKLKRDMINIVADILTKTEVSDVRATLWRAVSLLGSPVEAFKPWPEPWDAPIGWLPPNVDPTLRLYALYRTIIGYALLKVRGPDALRAFGVKPVKLNWLRTLSLDHVKVYHSIIVLSHWRKAQTSPFICALKLSAIWQ